MKKRIWVLTMFDDYFDSFMSRGVVASALKNDRGGEMEFAVNFVSIPKFCKKGFKGVDDTPFGGGVGMIMRADVLKNALFQGVVEPGGYDETRLKEQLRVIYPCPRGKVWSHDVAKKFAKNHFGLSSSHDIVFLCGRYEGVDERFLEKYVDEFYSLGDYILSGGELATQIILDSSLRFAEGVLGNKLSAVEESFANGKLEHALYTRPQVFEDISVPEALISGDPKKINKFKELSSKELTSKYRPDLIQT